MSDSSLSEHTEQMADMLLGYAAAVGVLSANVTLDQLEKIERTCSAHGYVMPPLLAADLRDQRAAA